MTVMREVVPKLVKLNQHNEVICTLQTARLLFGINEKLLTQHISGPVTKYKLLYVSNRDRAGARDGIGARHCHLLT